MEQQFIVSVPGQEVEVGDINLISENASFAVDRVLAELLRMGGVDRGIVPGGVMGGTASDKAGVIRSSGSANASVSFNPFRAVVGASLVGGADPLEAWQGLKSAVYIPGASVQFAAQPGVLNRIDLVYARVDVAVQDTPVTRYQKDSSDAVNAVSLSVTSSTRVSVGVVAGVPGATPARPALPSDSGASYYIRLGYVFLPGGFTLTSTVYGDQITETFDALHLAPSGGVSNMRPASINSRFDLTHEGPTVFRHYSFIPTSMVGGEQRLIAFHLNADGTECTLVAGTQVIDDSVDWRNRFFKFTVSATGFSLPFWGGVVDPETGSIADTLWTPISFYAATGVPNVLMGQSFKPVSGSAPLASIDKDLFGSFGASTTRIALSVDRATGKLMATLSGDARNINVVVWLEATGYYPNPG